MQSTVIRKGLVKKGWWYCILFFTFFVQAVPLQAQSISLSLKGAPIASAFRAIETQTGFHFIYSSEAIGRARPVSLELSGASVEEALVQVFAAQPLSYRVEDRQVFVKAVMATAQGLEVDVSGVVADEEGNPLQGVNVVVSGGSKGTTTDAAGAYFLSLVDEHAVLVFSFVGRERLEVAVKGRTVINVRLRAVSKALDETIIKGYYSTSNRFNTGNVSKVTASQIGRQPVSNVLAAMEGLVPGLFITQRNGMAGSDFDILIRGRNSIQNGKDPLCIIDGVPFPADRLTQINGFSTGNVFNSLNPNDIETIQVLKDADATAIYGSRGANGVILITTKKGTAGKTRLEATVYRGWGKALERLDFMNTSQYLEMRREAFENDGVTPTGGNARDLVAWDTTRYTNWKKYLIGGTAQTSNAQLTLSGGNEVVQFFSNASYYKQNTVFPGHFGNQRSTISINVVNVSPDKRLYIQLSGNFGVDEGTLPKRDVTSLLALPPNTPQLTDSLGRLLFSKNGYGFSNPLALMAQTYNVKTERLTGNAVIRYELFKGLRIKSSFGYNQNRSTDFSRMPIASQDPAYNPKGLASFANNGIRTWIAEPQIEYEKVLSSNVHLQTLIGATYQQNRSEYSSMSASGYTNDNLLNTTAGAAAVSSRLGNSTYRYHAVFSRVGVELAQKYLINLTGRRDGSSRFGPGKQFANFGAVGLGWIFSEEKLLEHSRYLSFGKLRGSYGITGNQPLSDYQYLDTWSATTYNYQGQSGLQPTRIFNPDYRWEQIRKLELAVDLGLFNNVFLLSAAWFENRSSNQIISYSLPAQTGFASVIRNFPGQVSNAGLEFTVSSTNVHKEHLHWTSSLNFTQSKNKLLSFPGLESSSYSNSYLVGRPLDLIKGYRYTGIDEQTGIYTFEDINKDNLVNTRDYVYLGTTNPKWYGGINNSLTYRTIQLDLFVQLVRQDGFEPVYGSMVASGTMLNNRPLLALSRWQHQGDVSLYQKYTQNFAGQVYNPATFNVASSSAVLVDASYVRLRNVSITWKVPAAALNKTKLEFLSLYMQAQNILTLTRYNGPDPEVQSVGSLPPLRVITVGVKIIL